MLHAAKLEINDIECVTIIFINEPEQKPTFQWSEAYCKYLHSYE